MKTVELNRINQLLKEATEPTNDKDVYMFDSPIEIFRWIKKEHQYLYVKKLENGKFEGRTDLKSKKNWILIDAQTANYAVKIYEGVNEENRKKLDSISLEKFLNIIYKMVTK